MGKMKDAFTPWGTVGDYADEKIYAKKDWPCNVWEMPVQPPSRPHRGYISTFDLSVMMGNQDYWNIEFFDTDANTLTMEQAIIAVEKRQYVELTMRNEIYKLLSFDGQHFLKELIE